MSQVIDSLFALLFLFLFTKGGYYIYKELRFETLTKVQRGLPSLENFTQDLTGEKLNY